MRLSEEAYKHLAAHKRENETFPEVVMRLAGERSLLDFVRILSDEDVDPLREAIGERRETPAANLEKNRQSPERSLACCSTRDSSST